ncbi:MAG: aminotransferase class I/II-fold pyridoxal phosphate-dependent enzyme [Candidatus ainarchaeum sp.]|nr:aminotransferase class I/II-fold pyridoxal phosphate-dependent enzyme [Candidatus ainarchaeum sp.]
MADKSGNKITYFKPINGKPRTAFEDGSWKNPKQEGPLGKIRWNNWTQGTMAVHAGALRGETGPHVFVPMYTGTTCPALTCGELAKRFANAGVDGKMGKIYARFGTQSGFELECILAGMHECGDALVFGSGMAAISQVFLSLVAAGDNVVVHRTMYGCTDGLCSKILPELGIEVRYVDLKDPKVLGEAIDERTRAVFFETPANPTLDLIDIKAVVKEVKNRCPVVVDNTFASPLGQNPFEQGANVVVYSMTKSIGGHSDALGGAILGSGKFIANLYPLRNDFGGVLPAREAASFLVGIKTLKIRYEKMQENARELAKILKSNSKVEKVYYPEFDKSYPLDGQMKGPGYMISFVLKDGLGAGKKFVEGLRLITNAVSLGGVESLVCHPASTTHSGVNAEQRKAKGIVDGLIRFSVGCEDLGDLKKDLQKGLDSI